MLRSFLPSVLRYSEAEGVEVCVADNGSTDQSVEMLRREFPSVRRILLDGNHGFADGYNLALRQVEAEAFADFAPEEKDALHGYLGRMQAGLQSDQPKEPKR